MNDDIIEEGQECCMICDYVCDKDQLVMGLCFMCDDEWGDNYE